MTNLANILELPIPDIGSGFIAHVPPGTYTVSCIRHETAKLFRTPKLVIWFRIVDMGPHFGKAIPRYYNIKRAIGKLGKHGGFQAGRSSDFVREYAAIFPDRITRLDRIAMQPFQTALIRAAVRTVTRDRSQRELATTLHYSVIERLIGASK